MYTEAVESFNTLLASDNNKQGSNDSQFACHALVRDKPLLLIFVKRELFHINEF